MFKIFQIILLEKVCKRNVVKNVKFTHEKIVKFYKNLCFTVVC